MTSINPIGSPPLIDGVAPQVPTETELPLIHRGKVHPPLVLMYPLLNHFSLSVLSGKTPPELPWPDIGYLAKWSVSSFKFGFGPECLRDGDPDTFWQ